jgi:hypothetical protein
MVYDKGRYHIRNRRDGGKGRYVKNKILNMNKPQEISAAEWKEIIEIPVIRESWGIEFPPVEPTPMGGSVVDC